MNKVKNTDATQATAVHNVHIVSAQDLLLDSSNCTISDTAFAVSMRVLMQNWRQGTVACKGRSDVAKTNKKPWKQKGTGRARAGSARSPIWRGGGTAHGPQARVRTLTIAKKQKRQVFGAILWDRLNESGVSAYNWNLQGEVPKTSHAAEFLKQNGLDNRKVIMFIKPTDDLVRASFSNIDSVRIVYFDHPNAFDLARADHWIFFKQDMDEFKKMVSLWI